MRVDRLLKVFLTAEIWSVYNRPLKLFDHSPKKTSLVESAPLLFLQGFRFNSRLLATSEFNSDISHA